MSRKEIITRFPPSPTGSLHIGNVRTALFNFLFTRQNEGKFFIRVEDTDIERSKREYEEEMLRHMEWLGLNHDNETIWRQTERTEVYKSYLQRLIEEDKVYISIETEGKNKEVVRFRNPNKKVVFEDLIRGSVEFDTTELGDFIIARNINEPVYHLAVVVDDFESGITHVIRGEDHISNTPRQILIQEAIGAPRPIYAHLPLILSADRSKLSKRKHGERVSLTYYRNQGYLPQAINNFFALLGWNPGDDREIFTLEELIKEFDITKIQKGGAIFDEKKLRWVNKEHMKRLPREEVAKAVVKRVSKYFSVKNIPDKLVDVIIERIEVYSDIDQMVEVGELDYFFNKPELEADKIAWKDVSSDETVEHLTKAIKIIREGSDLPAGQAGLMSYAESVGKGNVLWPVRYSLSGREKSPDPFTLIAVLGNDESVARLENAIRLLK